MNNTSASEFHAEHILSSELFSSLFEGGPCILGGCFPHKIVLFSSQKCKSEI